MTAKWGKVTVTSTGWRCRCERCGHIWRGLGKKPPQACAACKSRYWNVPRGTLKRGPKPKTR